MSASGRRQKSRLSQGTQKAEPVSEDTWEKRPQIPDSETEIIPCTKSVCHRLIQLQPQMFRAQSTVCPEENAANWKWVPTNDTAPWPRVPWPGCGEHPQNTGPTFQVLFNWTEGQNTGTGSRPPGDAGLLAATQTAQRTDWHSPQREGGEVTITWSEEGEDWMALMGAECCQGALSTEEQPLYGQIPQDSPAVGNYLYFQI